MMGITSTMANDPNRYHARHEVSVAAKHGWRTSVTAPASDRLVALLGRAAPPGAFSARRTAPRDDLCLEVRGVGQIPLPVSETQAKQLCQLGRPARYGWGAQTLTDSRVRDTYEIPKSRVKIDKRRWNATLLPILDRLRRDLDLSAGCELRAEFHSMLVYAKGQFFVPHQDSEKADAMIGSLVVTLPSSFKGGALVVEHGGETATYRSSKLLSFVAFYADCHHQVKPVRSGHRIVLTYNLLLRGETTAAPAPALAEELARTLDDHFATPLPSPRVAGGVADPPNRLVYLLDHEYTPSGLSWSRLKGSDASRVALLQAAASKAGCDIVLALADIHETWSAVEVETRRPWYSRPRRGRWDDPDAWDDDDLGDEVDLDDYELEELLDWSITLDGWIDPSGAQPEPLAPSVSAAEVCSTTPCLDLQPYNSEYEGYMGNYGNTLDRWYHRVAVVLWPRQRAFAVHAEASTIWALDALTAQLKGGDVTTAHEMVATLAPFWDKITRGEQPRSVFTKALRIARAVNQEGLATMLLSPFRQEMVAKGQAKAMAALVEHYGLSWADELLATWSGRQSWGPSGQQDRLVWMAGLGTLCGALATTGASGGETARLLLARSWRWLIDAIERRSRLTNPTYRDEALGELGPAIAAVLTGTAIIVAVDLQDEALGVLCQDNDALTACLLPALRSATSLPTAQRRDARLDVVAQHCATRLTARLTRPRRADDDWSIEVPAGCDCQLCIVLGRFLVDPAQRSYEWPLAKEARRHVHSRIDGAELPVVHQTRRTGRPYTLVLTKTDALFERERQARRRAEADAAWLDREWGANICSDK